MMSVTTTSRTAAPAEPAFVKGFKRERSLDRSACRPYDCPMLTDGPEADNVRAGRLPLLLIFFLSGASGLVYEVVWSRSLVLVFGSTTHAVSTVLAAFMGGLALGSIVVGRRGDRLRSPLRIYALLEVAIAALAL